MGLYVYIEMLSHEPCHAHTLPRIGQGCFGCFVYKYFLMFSFHIPISRICFSPICGRRGWYACPRGVCSRRVTCRPRVFCGQRVAGWLYTPRGRAARRAQGRGLGRSKCGNEWVSSMISFASLLALHIRQLFVYVHIYQV